MKKIFPKIIEWLKIAFAFSKTTIIKLVKTINWNEEQTKEFKDFFKDK